MKLLLGLLPCMLLLPLTARADTTFTFNNGTTSPYNGSFSGTVDIDTATGTITGQNILYTSGTLGTFLFTQAPVFQGAFNSDAFFAEFDNADAEFELLLNTPTLVAFTGANVCTVSQPCDGATGGIYTPDPANPGGTQVMDQFASGALGSQLPAGVTPEPGTLALVGTGVLGVFTTFRRRISLG